MSSFVRRECSLCFIRELFRSSFFAFSCTGKSAIPFRFFFASKIAIILRKKEESSETAKPLSKIRVEELKKSNIKEKACCMDTNVKLRDEAMGYRGRQR